MSDPAAAPQDPRPIGADAVIAPRGSTVLATLRLARARLRLRGRLKAGRGVHVAPGVRLTAARGAVIELGDGVQLGEGCRIEAGRRGVTTGPGRGVTIGPGARLGARTVVVALADVRVGAEAVIGDWAMVTDAEQAAGDVETPIRRQPVTPRAVRIGNGARIGAHAAVLAGATVGEGEAVGSYAVVAAPVRSP